VKPPWWAALPAVETRIRCGTGEHVLRWSEGRLNATDHPDAKGELVLAALGGDKAECVAMLEAWGAHGDDLEVLALGPRSPADELAVTWELVEELRTISGRRTGSTPMRPGPASGGGSATFSALSYSAPSRGARPAARVRGMPMRRLTPEQERALARRTELLSLFALGRDFQPRLSAQVVSAWSGGETSADPRRRAARPALVAALTGRLAPAAGPWAGLDPDEVGATLHEGPGWGSAERDGPGLRAALPLSWLARVWAPGFPVVGGHLVVDVLAGSWPRVQVLGLPAPGAEPAVLSIQADGEHWSLARGEADSTAGSADG
jgi:hypothetical protein